MNNNTQNNQNIEPHIEPQKLKRPLDNLRYLIVAGLLGGLFWFFSTCYAKLLVKHHIAFLK